MMKRTQLLEYIADPDLLASASLQDLETLCDEFPYCQTTHLLYIKALSEQKSVLYHARLKKTAAHIPDRSVLYYLIHSQPKKIPLIVSEKREEFFNPPPPEEKAVPEKIIRDSKPFASIDEILNRVRDLSAIEIPDLSPLAAKLENLQREHLHRVEDIVRAYLTLRAVTEAEFLKEKEEAAADLSDKAPVEEVEPITETASPEVKVQAEETPVHKSELNHLTIDTEIEEPETPLTEKQTEHKSGHKGPARIHPGKKALLINKFIETAPSMPKPKKEFYNPVNMAHNSTVDREDLVSETLAEIYLKQGNIHKALKIYQRLCLIIPEKSTYFAARIEKLKKENNLL